jgi:hypothetical protein
MAGPNDRCHGHYGTAGDAAATERSCRGPAPRWRYRGLRQEVSRAPRRERVGRPDLLHWRQLWVGYAVDHDLRLLRKAARGVWPSGTVTTNRRLPNRPKPSGSRFGRGGQLVRRGEPTRRFRDGPKGAPPIVKRHPSGKLDGSSGQLGFQVRAANAPYVARFR